MDRTIDYFAEIRSMFEASGLEDINFHCHRDKPTFSKDYTTYEIWSIDLDREEDKIYLSTIPIDPWMGKVVDFTLDSSWRRPTLQKILRIVEKELGWRWK